MWICNNRTMWYWLPVKKQYWATVPCLNILMISNSKYHLKVAVSFWFSQGLLILMRDNLKLKADINFFFFVLHRHRSKVAKFYDLTPRGFVIAFAAKWPFFIILDSTPKLYYMFQFFFLIMIHTWLTNKPSSFCNCINIDTGISDFHKLTSVI